MRVLAARAVLASLSALCALSGDALAQTVASAPSATPAAAQAPANPEQAPTPQSADSREWVARAEELARFVESNSLLLTDQGRADRASAVARMRGDQKLQGLYDLAVKFYIDGDAQAGSAALTALETEAHAQNSARYLAIAGMVRAYAPARA